MGKRSRIRWSIINGLDLDEAQCWWELPEYQKTAYVDSALEFGVDAVIDTFRLEQAKKGAQLTFLDMVELTCKLGHGGV